VVVIDSHLDLAWNALNWNRDLTRSVREIRQAESGMKDVRRGANTVAFPEMRQGKVGVCLATVLARASGLNEPLLDYRTREIAYAMAKGQLAYYRALEKEGILKMLLTFPALREHVDRWTRVDFPHPPLGFILSMEGADPILTPSQVKEWWDDGLRVVGPAHYGLSAYAHGTASSGGLTAQGKELLKAMKQVGMVLDLTHLAEESFWEAAELFPGPVLASHNNCRALVPGDRQFSDEQIRYLIKRDSVIGVAFDDWMLYPNWTLETTPKPAVSLEAVVDQIEHICQLAGNARHVGIGSDLDGGFGREQSPHDLDTIADLQIIPALLRKRRYNESDIAGIMHGNWLRFFEKSWASK
jgi:membrane dipeptidase